MTNLQKVDEARVSLQLGRSKVVLDIPSATQAAGYDPNAAAAAPDEQLCIEWVYGTRGKDARNNLIFLTDSAEVVYCMAAVVVLLHPENRKQRHYTEHTDDIKSIAIHPDRNTIATGQVSGHKKIEGKAHVRVWLADSLQTLHVIGENEFQRSVCCLAFSSFDRGELLCAVDEADDHHLSVWDWKSANKLCQAKGSKEPILDVEFNPHEPNAIVSCGRGQISFWTIDDNRNLKSKRGIFKGSWMVQNILETEVKENDKESPKYILGLAFSPKGFLVSGDSNGSILIWDKGRNRISRELAGAHTDAVFSLTFLRDGRLVTGGRAGMVVLWDAACQRKLADARVAPEFGPVRCIVQGVDDVLYLQTIKNSLLFGSFTTGFQPITIGHRDEIWGLSAHSSSGRFVTCGDDRLVAMRDADSYELVWQQLIKQGAHCCDLNPDGSLLLIGCQTGHFVLLSAADGSQLQHRKVSREQIEDLKFSPDGQHAALASRDNKIYLMKLSNDKKLDDVAECQGHTSFVTHIDWSADGKLLRSNSGDYELLYWKMPQCQREFSDEATRDAKWHTTSCTLAFEVAGIWREANDGTDVNAVAANASCSLCASGDDFGSVNLYRMPCCVAEPAGFQAKGHSSHVTAVQFLADGKRLVTCGGRDMAVIQWKLC